MCAAWGARHAAHTPHTTQSNFGQAQYGLPDDGLYGPKHVGVTVKECFNANFNI